MTEVSDPRTPVDNFSEVKSLNQWVCWSYKKGKGQKPKKAPTHPTGGYDINPLKPSNWLTYDEAVLYSESPPSWRESGSSPPRRMIYASSTSMNA